MTTCSGAEGMDEQHWWLWAAWVTQSGKPRQHVYGLLTPTRSACRPCTETSTKLPSGATLHVAESVGLSTTIATLKAEIENNAACIRLSTLIPDAPDIDVDSYRQTICQAFGHRAAKVLGAYAFAAPSVLLVDGIDARLMIETCTRAVGLALGRTHAMHLGGFDLFELGGWLDNPIPYGSAALNPRSPREQHRIRIWRTQTRARQIAHLRACADGEVVHEGAHFLAAGSDILYVDVGEAADAYTLSIFDDDTGTLRYTESAQFLMEVEISSQTIGRVVQHKDKLEAEAQRRSRALHQRAATTAALHATRSHVSFDARGFRAHRMAVQNRLDEVMPEPSSDRWFARTDELGLGVLDHINRILGASQAQEAVLVDPYFGKEALHSIATRLSNANLRLTIVASWGRVEPDTGRAIEGVEARIAFGPKTLKPVFAAIGALVNVGLRFRNVVTTDGRAAFHDRYLLIKTHAGTKQLYLLSNSVNRMAVNWPFCMSELSGEAKIDAIRYVEGLANEQDGSQAASPTTNFEWSNIAFKRGGT